MQVLEEVWARPASIAATAGGGGPASGGPASGGSRVDEVVLGRVERLLALDRGVRGLWSYAAFSLEDSGDGSDDSDDVYYGYGARHYYDPYDNDELDDGGGREGGYDDYDFDGGEF